MAIPVSGVNNKNNVNLSILFYDNKLRQKVHNKLNKTSIE